MEQERLDVGRNTELDDNQISGNKIEEHNVTISQLSGSMDCNNQAMTNVDINSGNIDGTTIGANGHSGVEQPLLIKVFPLKMETQTGFIDFYDSNNGTNKINLKDG